jgi:DNA-binding response OmpR family regulator
MPTPGPIAPTYDAAVPGPATPADRSRGPILVVDDDAKIVRLVRTYLERAGHRVTEARDGRGALAAIALESPALVVLDVMLPEVDGLAVLRAVRRGGSKTPVLILSARGTVGDRIAGLAAGADDYLPKPFSPSELVLRVERILERATAVSTTSGRSNERAASAVRPTLKHGDLVVDRDRHEASIDGRPLSLTSVEFRLLVTILEADGRVLSRDQLLDAVHGEDAVEILDRTIDVHIRRLRDKLDDDPEAPRYVATVRGAGYRAAPLPHSS